MGQQCSKGSEPLESGVTRTSGNAAPEDVKLEGDSSFSTSERSRAHTAGGSRFSSSMFPGRGSLEREEELAMPELQANLEKLDEERTRLQEQLKRLQAIELQDGGGGLDDATSGTRVRFSRADQTSDAVGGLKPMKHHPMPDRRASFGGAMRVSTYKQAEALQDKRPDTKEQLAEMLTRSRRRTRFNHRSSEGGTTGMPPPYAYGDPL